MGESKMKKILFVATVTVATLAMVYQKIWNSVWGVGYNLENCPGCQFKIDWSNKERPYNVSGELVEQFQRDGVIVLPNILDTSKVGTLRQHVTHELPNTFMTDVVARFTLPHYLKYEHHLDTRSELIRDWAFGPLAQWAAQLMQVDSVRLYNAEAIYHKGSDSPAPCRPAWHRDTIAAPFADADVIPAVTFNVYLEDIGADAPHGDVLIYQKGSHLDITKPPTHPELIEPQIRVGDLLAHNPNSYHTPSGRGCWKRRSLQFRYVAAFHPHTGEPTKFHFDKRRWPHGPIPWSLAQSPELFPHGLNNGDVLQGPGYPLVYPQPLPEEHRPLNGTVWTLRSALAMAKESQAMADKKEEGFFFLDGPLKDAADWEEIEMPGTKLSMLMHKEGPGYKFNKALLDGAAEE